MPEEFDWVVGCSYRGLPAGEALIRNPIGSSMSLRRQAAVEAGGFRPEVGRVGTFPVGCEETELAIRLRRLLPWSRTSQPRRCDITPRRAGRGGRTFGPAASTRAAPRRSCRGLKGARPGSLRKRSTPPECFPSACSEAWASFCVAISAEPSGRRPSSPVCASRWLGTSADGSGCGAADRSRRASVPSPRFADNIAPRRRGSGRRSSSR
jgi:hypothetical protein